ncbi:MAG: FkbM family methyltransferase [Methylovirgula sp.]
MPKPMTLSKWHGNDLSLFGRYKPHGAIARLLALTRRSSASWAGMRRAFFLRSMAIKVLRGRPLDVEALGALMRLYPYNNVCEKRILFTPQYFDPAERELLRKRMKPDFIFLDIGANIGGYSLFVAACANQGARILAIEPQPEIFERLVYNIRQNPFATIKAIDCAVADIDTEITLFIDPENRGETSMRIINSDVEGIKIRVPAKALASIVAEEGFERIDAMKLDVEGAEDLILEPYFREMPETLWPELLLIEFVPQRWTIDLPALLAELGYQAILRTRHKVVFERMQCDEPSVLARVPLE